MESVLNRAPSVTGVDRRLIELIEEAARQLKQGESVDLERVIEEHPSHADALRELLPTLTALVGLAEDTAASQSRSGSQLGRYQLMARLGRGGMGVVYMALHTDLQKVVALKVLNQRRMSDPHAASRFKREMIAAGKFDHPRLVRAVDAGEEGGTQFLVMEYIDGVDLSELVRRRGPLGIASACDIVRQAAEGLQHVHEAGLIHRDVKPSNLMINQAGEVKILDLGLARLHDGAEAFHTELTGAGHLIGTVDYMAPEQGDEGQAVDARADVYSLGATLFQLLAGRPPYGGEECNTPLKKLMAIATLPAPGVRELRPEVPEALERVVAKMLSKQPDDRFASAAEVAEALAPFAEGSDLQELIRASRSGYDAGQGRTLKSGASLGQPTAAFGGATSDLASGSHGRPRGTWWLIALGAAGWATALAAIFLIVRDRDGNERARVRMESGDRLEIADVKGEGEAVVAAAATEPARAPAAKAPEPQAPAVEQVVARQPTEKYTLFAPDEESGAETFAEYFRKSHPQGSVTLVESLRGLPGDDGVLLIVMDKDAFTSVGEYSPDELKQRRIVGIGYGAAKLFGELGLAIDWGACAHGVYGEPRVTVLENTLVDRVKFESPIFVFDPPVIDETSFHNDHFFGVYVGDKKPERREQIEVVALQTRDRNYAPIAQQGKQVLVCVDAPAEKWSQDMLRLVDAVSVGLDSRE